MKKNITFILACAITCLLLFGCSPRNENHGDLIHINVSRSHPTKEININEIATVEFLQLPVYDDFLFRGNPRVITENKIVFGDTQNGDVLFFSRDGRPLSRFNHRGQGPQEYNNITRLLFDEETDEVFILSQDRLLVFSSTGVYKRTLSLPEQMSLPDIAIFDDEKLLLLRNYSFVGDPQNPEFWLISREDGHLIEMIDLPKDDPVTTFHMVRDDNMVSIMMAPTNHIVRYKDGFLLSEFSLDTVFFLSPNRELTPIMTRSPAIQSMNPITFVNSFVEASDYQFFHAVTVRLDNNRLPQRFLMRNRRTGAVYEQRFIFDEFRGRELFISPNNIATTQNSRIGLISLDLTELQDALDDGKLSGRLKEIVEQSDFDGNNVFMLLHFRD